MGRLKLAVNLILNAALRGLGLRALYTDSMHPAVKWGAGLVGALVALLLYVSVTSKGVDSHPRDASTLSATASTLLCQNWFDSKWDRFEDGFASAISRGRAGEAGTPFGAAQASWDGLEPEVRIRASCPW